MSLLKIVLDVNVIFGLVADTDVILRAIPDVDVISGFTEVSWVENPGSRCSL
jgi:hypothetical protein